MGAPARAWARRDRNLDLPAHLARAPKLDCRVARAGGTHAEEFYGPADSETAVARVGHALADWGWTQGHVVVHLTD